MSEVNVTSDSTSAVVEAHGENAREQLKKYLEIVQSDLQGQITRMKVEIETDGSDQVVSFDPEESTDSDEEEDEEQFKQFKDPEELESDKRTGPAKTGPQEGPQNQTSRAGISADRLTEDDREAKGFQPWSSYHAIASMIDRSQQDRWLGTDVIDAVEEHMPRGTVTGGLTELYRRKILDRRKVNNPDGKDPYKYWISDHGEEVLEGHTDYSPQEWAEQ